MLTLVKKSKAFSLELTSHTFLLHKLPALQMLCYEIYISTTKICTLEDLSLLTAALLDLRQRMEEMASKTERRLRIQRMNRGQRPYGVQLFIAKIKLACCEMLHRLLATDPEVRVRFPALAHFLRSSGSGTGFTQPR
jgi:hypothetical protein